VKRRTLLISILLVQAICAIFFVSDIALTVIGIRLQPISWQTREFLEIGASLGLILGLVLGAMALRQSHRRADALEDRLRIASGAFHELIEDRFTSWQLTAAEHDVAMFLLKGLSIQEIAGLRATSEGTVKAQSNAIYRKAGVSGRPQLLSLFIDDLMGDELTPVAEKPAERAGRAA